jgi:hypothetical protein
LIYLHAWPVYAGEAGPEAAGALVTPLRDPLGDETLHFDA